MSGSQSKVLILGGTAWLGHQLAREALDRGHAVWCLARAESGPPPDGARLIRADRRSDGAYEEVRARDWDAVVDVAWQPGWVRSALAALRGRVGHWTYVSSGSVYGSHAIRGADESAELLAPTDLDEVGPQLYGQAKVACELACRSESDSNLLIARSGLIGGPGDPSDRAGYWVARAARDPVGPMLVPGRPDGVTQVMDVRDLASWLIDCAENHIVGIYDAVGPMIALADWIDLSRRIGGHTGAVVRAGDDWLLAEGVDEFMGPGSLPLWLADPDWLGFCARGGEAAAKAGLAHRPVSETLTDTLEWEREQGLDRVRKSGLPAEREAELIGRLKAARARRKPVGLSQSRQEGSMAATMHSDHLPPLGERMEVTRALEHKPWARRAASADARRS
ncbi:MAG TPA: NAD-dependent epimerase/dehydratase family protein [Solirubrobacteraceae bacterium]|jgi:nucleoside-diphosphate-sugar epimerase|nr:NAD-dependent epimerase/dehydratase family protein [Solirubrobacteraceae bacterium]